ncbi:MAG: hypothetical protein KC731_37195 [Myxococcales bacterium]|nr:hypothetical protein [Myxococcales bacterium]
MSAPPTDLAPSEIFRKLLETPAPSEIYNFPRKGVDKKIRIMVLGVEDHDRARKAAAKRLKEEGYTHEDLRGNTLAQVEGDLVARELLCLAIRDVEPIPGSENSKNGIQYPYVFTGVEALNAARLTRDELTVLFSMYELTQARFGPYEGSIDNELELTRWIEVLVKGASADPLSRCSFLHLVESNMLLARRAFLLSALLESQRSSLPPTLVSILDGLGTGTTSLGELPARCIQSGWAGDEWFLFDDPALDGMTEDNGFADDTKKAARLAEKLHKHGG